MSARPRWFAALSSDPWRLRLLRLFVAVALIGLVWAVDRYGGMADVAPEPGSVDRSVRADLPPPPPEPTATDDIDAAAEASSLTKNPSPTETPSVTQAPSRAASRDDRDAVEPTASSPPRQSKPTPKSPPKAPSTTADPLVISGLSLRDSNGRTIYRGEIDLAPTVERIRAGRRLRFPNDGTTFQNRENRLPRRPAGYYREWVVPTPKEPGPGPQRLITGEEGEVWYTHDHYRSFRRLPTEIRIR